MAITPGGDSSRALAKLGILAGPGTGEELPLRTPVVTIGKGSQNDVVLADDSISTVHARVEYEGGHWRVTDLDSTNGTYLEGGRLAPNVPTSLSYGQSIRFGGVRMQFREVGDADPEAARASYAPPPAPSRVADRGGFRLPVWLFVLILVLVGLIVFFLVGGPDLGRDAEPAAETLSAPASPAPPDGP